MDRVELKRAVTALRENLKEDEGLFYGYQSNIAMAFKDEYRRNSKRYKNKQDLHDIANTAAKNFLNTFIGKGGN